MSKSWRVALPWILTGVVSVLAIFAWGQSLGWTLSSLYQFFPVLGLLAYSIMWSHYVAGAGQRTVLHGIDLTDYFRYTSYVVLGAILLHPAIFVYQLYRDGYGLPPGSYAYYVGQGAVWVVLLGVISLFIFLAYELHRWYSNRSWWKYVLMAGDAAMLAIFYHGLRLGGQLQNGWYRYVWFVFGITLVAILLHKYISLAIKFQKRTTTMS